MLSVVTGVAGEKAGRRWVGIVGPACAGKSTAAHAVASVPGVFVVPEPLPAAELAALATESPARDAGFNLQSAIISGKFRAASESPADCTLLFDRTLTEDRLVFFPIHRDVLGTLNDVEVRRLTEQCKAFEYALGPPALLIELRAPDSILRKRFESVDRPSWLLSTLSEQMSRYNRWLAADFNPRIAIDTSVCERATVRHSAGRQWTQSPKWVPLTTFSL